MSKKYFYRARDRKGIVVRGSLEAEDVWLARKALSKMNLIVLEIERFNIDAVVASVTAWWERVSTRVKLEEKLVFIGQLEAGFSVGIPLLQVLTIIHSDSQNKALRNAVGDIISEISQGTTLHAAFAKHPELFDPTVTGLIRIGEASGELEAVLGRISKMLEQKSENAAKFKSALFYPKIVVVVMLLVLLTVVYFVIPKIKVALGNMGVELPWITRAVVSVSDFCLHYWYLILAATFGIKVAFGRLVSSEAGRLRRDQLLLRIPVFGELLLFLELNNFCVVLELLTGSGVPLVEALETLKGALSNEAIKKDLQICQDEIIRGGTLHDGLAQSQRFPASFRSLISIGEETGRMQPVLNRLAKSYQVQVDYRLANLSKLIEPILLAIIFSAVTVLALAIFLPVWEMSSGRRPN